MGNPGRSSTHCWLEGRQGNMPWWLDQLEYMTHSTHNKAFKVTVRDACWKCKSQEISKADALQSNAQFLFFCTVATCEQHGEGDALVITEKVLPVPYASHSPLRKRLAVAVVLITISPAAWCTEQYELVWQHFTIRLAQDLKRNRFLGWHIAVFALWTHSFNCFAPLMTIQKQAQEIPEIR